MVGCMEAHAERHREVAATKVGVGLGFALHEVSSDAAWQSDTVATLVGKSSSGGGRP